MHASVHHVTIAASTLDVSATFYDEILQPLGWDRRAEFGDEEEDDLLTEAIAYAAAEVPLGEAPLWLVAATGAATQGAHIALRVSTESAVIDSYERGLRAGGTAHQAPRHWEVYRPGYFGATVRDPDSNLVEFFVDESR